MNKNSNPETDRHEIQAKQDISYLIDQNYTIPTPLSRIEPFEEAWEVDNLLTREESRRILQTTDQIGYGKTHYNPFYRGNLRLILDDPALARALWPRVQALLGPNFTVKYKNAIWHPVGLNTRFRFSKYYPGHKFERHVDDYYVRTNQQSMLTLNIYLNDNSAATRFYYYVKDKARTVDIIPQAGRAILFRQAPHADYLHAGLKVVQGFKYLMRTDVMFMKK